jgi:hypothetical protein
MMLDGVHADQPADDIPLLAIRAAEGSASTGS